MVNAWHDVYYGKKAPEEVKAIIEIPKNSSVKYEINKDTGMLELDRVLYSAVHYPGDYGFIPQTYWEDGDPLDVVILSSFPVFPMTIVTIRPIGVINMIDGGDSDAKVIAVYADDPRYHDYKDLNDIPKHLLNELTHFFETYKLLQKKTVEIKSVEGAAEAKQCILKGIENYKELMKEKK